MEDSVTAVRHCGRQKPAGERTMVATVAGIAVVPDAMEALGQHVHKEPPNELGRLQRHVYCDSCNMR
jgi:hypothetical protein